MKRMLLVGMLVLLCGSGYAADTREIRLQCSGFRVQLNPATSVVKFFYPGLREPFRYHSDGNPRFITIKMAAGHMRIDRNTNTYAVLSHTNQPKGWGVCEVTQ